MSERAKRTAAAVRAARMIGLAKRPRMRLPRQMLPRGIAREYARELLRVVARTREAFAPLLAELPALLESAARERNDAARIDAGEGRRIRELVERAKRSLDQSVSPADVERLAEKFAARTATWQRVQLNRQTQAALGADVFLRDEKLAAMVEGFVAENVALIKNIPDKIAAEVETAATRAVQNGRLHPELAKELEQRFGYGTDRAKLIARDQVGKLYGQINAARQKELGAERFIWRTLSDDRVRDEHEALDGQSFSYAEGGHPTEGLPGEPILCRCYAEPDFSAILGDL